jgi:type II secretory pathway pseudopilin PulG
MKRLSQGAFTLVEVLAGLLLFSLGVMSVIGVVLYGLKSAAMAQADATAWSTALSVLKDPLPQGGTFDASTQRLVPWTWTVSGANWTASDGSALPVWESVSWDPATAGDITSANMSDPPPLTGALAPGCSRGWINGYYVERREQSLASDRLGAQLRLVEVRVDVFLEAYLNSSRQPLASAVDRVVRNGGL